MESSRDKRFVIGKKLDIPESDLIRLENAQRRRIHNYRILSGIEALIGLFSFIGGYYIGYAVPDGFTFTGYPFSVILMSVNIPSFLELKKKRGILLLPAITLLIIILGIISGYVLGSATAPIYEPEAIRYNVYSKSQ